MSRKARDEVRMSKVGFGFLDRYAGRRTRAAEARRQGRGAHEQGYDSLREQLGHRDYGSARLDAVSVLGAMAATTERVRLGSCIVNSWTRGPALMAMTFATLDNLAPGRMNLGLGAYWDPLAWKQGIERRKPLTQMREYVGVLRRLLALEDGVTHEGELVTVRDLTLDLGHGDPRTPPAVKIFIGPTGPRMMELSGEIADGALINGILRPPTRAARWSASPQARRARAARSPTWRSCSSSTSRWTRTARRRSTTPSAS